MNISQIVIMITGALAIWLVGRKESWSKYGFIVGLLGEPFWLYETYQTQQWGIFIMCIFYTYSWSSGVYNNFFKKKQCKYVKREGESCTLNNNCKYPNCN